VQFGDTANPVNVTLSGNTANNYSGETNLGAGVLHLAKSSGDAIPGNLNVLGGMVQSLGSNQIADSAIVFVAPGASLELGNTVEMISGLSGGGTTNINGALLVNYSGASPAGSLRALLASGYASGAWNGPGISSSAAALIAANPSNPHQAALGFAEASSLFAGDAVFAGQNIDTTTLLIKYTWSGDANLDGLVNALDFNALASNFGGTTGELWNQGDFNYDGVTNTADFTALASNFNQPALASAPLGSLIPSQRAWRCSRC